MKLLQTTRRVERSRSIPTIFDLRPIFSARVGLGYRALAVRNGDALIWFWIGSHADYDKLLRSL